MAPMAISFGIVVALMAFLAVRRNTTTGNQQQEVVVVMNENSLSSPEQQQKQQEEGSHFHHQKQQEPQYDDNISRSSNNMITSSALQKARQIRPPPVTLTSGGEYEHGDFWKDHDDILKRGWDEWWEQCGSNTLPSLLDRDNRRNNKMMNPKLLKTIQRLRENPTEERETILRQEFFKPILKHHVFQTKQWFTPYGVRVLRQHLDAASYYYNNTNADTNTDSNFSNATSSSSTDTNITDTVKANIPTRRPNGMNRYGIIIDPNIEGAVTYEHLNTYIHDVLVKEYVRPIARMLFPEFTSRYTSNEDDIESYAFTIRYNPTEDLELKEHSDASIFTININLNLPSNDNNNCQSEGNNSEGNVQCQEEYDGSTLYFLNPDKDHDHDQEQTTATRTNVTFAPGMAVIHRGIVRHAALPITNGERHNLVIWLFGKHGYVRIGEYPSSERLTVQERWSTKSNNNNKNKLKSLLNFGGGGAAGGSSSSTSNGQQEDKQKEKEIYTDEEL